MRASSLLSKDLLLQVNYSPSLLFQNGGFCPEDNWHLHLQCPQFTESLSQLAISNSREKKSYWPTGQWCFSRSIKYDQQVGDIQCAQADLFSAFGI